MSSQAMSDVPIGDPPQIPEERREPPEPSQPPVGEPPPPREPEDPPPAQQPPVGDPLPSVRTPEGDPPDSSRQIKVCQSGDTRARMRFTCVRWR